MDPISQGAVGAALAQSASRSTQTKQAMWLGVLAGMAPDLDVFISSASDPLLFLEYHRQFTHSLTFAPLGALIVALVLHRFLGRGLTFGRCYLYCFLGYVTHGLLDACTSYGTQLLWPVSDARVAWNFVSVVDPLFSLPIVGLIIAGAIRKQPWFGRIAIAWAIAYLALGFVQHTRVEAEGFDLANSRGHQPTRFEAKPAFANLLLWKVVYEAQGRYYVDAIRVGVRPVVFEGNSTEKLDPSKHLPWMGAESQQAKDVERFRWFSNDYLAADADVENRVIDVRYSVVPNEVDALWGIDLDPAKGPHEHVIWRPLRNTDDDQVKKWWSMLVN